MKGFEIELPHKKVIKSIPGGGSLQLSLDFKARETFRRGDDIQSF